MKIKDEDNSQGGRDQAQHTLVEFSDFQCPACKTAEPFVRKLSETQSGLKIIYRHFPLPQHPIAFKAVLASEAADLQGKFWLYKERLFENQENLSQDTLGQIAKELELDLTQFKKDLNSVEILARVQKDLEDGRKLGVNGTPTFFLDGEKLQPSSFDDLLKLVAQKLRQSLEVSNSP